MLNLKKSLMKATMALMAGIMLAAPVNAATIKNKAVSNVKIAATRENSDVTVKVKFYKVKNAKKYKIVAKKTSGKTLTSRTISGSSTSIVLKDCTSNKMKLAITPIDKKGKKGKVKTVAFEVKASFASATPQPNATPVPDVIPSTETTPNTETTPAIDSITEEHTHDFHEMSINDVARFDLDNWYMNAYLICDCGELKSTCPSHEWRDPVESDATDFNRVLYQGDKVCDKCHIVDSTNRDTNNALFDIEF